MAKQQIGLIGLAVMGENLALNIENQGFSVAVYNRTPAKTDTFIFKRTAGKNIKGTYSIEELVASLERPRKILMMVRAGKDANFYKFNLSEIARIWKGGCIIRAGFLDKVKNGLDRFAVIVLEQAIACSLQTA